MDCIFMMGKRKCFSSLWAPGHGHLAIWPYTNSTPCLLYGLAQSVWSAGIPELDTNAASTCGIPSRNTTSILTELGIRNSTWLVY